MKCFSRLGCCIDREEFAMLRRVVSVVFVIGALAALMNVAPMQSVAQLASPSAGAPGPGSPPTQDLCTNEEIKKGDTSIVVEPLGVGGVVEPVDAPDHVLWVVQITVPPQSCRAFQSSVFDRQLGPIVLFAQSGSIEYGVSSATTPPATVMMGHQDAAPQPVPLDTLVPLHSGDWVTQDRAAWFTYRNPGPGSAVVLMAAFVVPDPAAGSGGKG
jgi:hypothetical protein